MNETVLWQSLRWFGAERCTLSHSAAGHILAGTALLSLNDVPMEIGYRVEVDTGWVTRSVEVDVLRPEGWQEIRLVHDGAGNWESSGDRLTFEARCLDIDLGFSPSTNTLPIRRFAELAVGDGVDLVAAWVEFPSLLVKELPQRYERLAERRWRYRSGTFSAVLEVDEHGLVLDYADFWRVTATGAAIGSG